MEGQEKINNKQSVSSRIEDIIFYIIFIPIIALIVIILWQVITEPEKIPNIFGYKMFIIIDGKMDESIDYGDLAFTHNINPDELKLNDVIAFRNEMNTVTIHKIIDINKVKESRRFTMRTAINETSDTKYVNGERVEGILVGKIPKLGAIILLIQKPLVIILIILIILIAGLIAYYIAQQLDKRDMERLKEKEQEDTE